jgi:3-oxoacyl-[acyl-carrier protein] reductase
MAAASRRTGRPGSVDTAMQAWIRARPQAKISAALHERFARSYEEGSLITPGQSARSLMHHLAADATARSGTSTPADLRSEAR